MGWYVHLHVSFACDNNDGVAKLAQQHLDQVDPIGERRSVEALWFLADLAKRTGPNPGPKGGLSLWGMIGNHTNVERFVAALNPFWEDLLSEQIDGGPCSHEHVLVFEEQEQSKQARAYEIFLDSLDELIVLKRSLPFYWNQM